MTTLRTALAAALLLGASLPGAVQANGIVQTVEQSLGELDRALFAPREVERFAPIDDTWTCDQLSLEVTRLTPQSRSYRKSFYHDPVNAAVGALGTVFPAAFYLWGVPEYARHREKRHVVNAKARIAALRDALADRQCYVR